MGRSGYRFAYRGGLSLRASTVPTALGDVADLDLASPADELRRLWANAELREALAVARPEFAARVEHLAGAGHPASPVRHRAALLSLTSYLRRWQRRATPFGLFAGVCAPTTGRAIANLSGPDRAIARVDAEWLADRVRQLRADHTGRESLTVVSDNTAVISDGRVVLPHRPEPGRPDTAGRQISVRLTGPIHRILVAATTPIEVRALIEKVGTDLPAAPDGVVSSLVHQLIENGLLITSLRIPMTATDPLPALVAALRRSNHPPYLDTAAELAEISALITEHNTVEATHVPAFRQEIGTRLTARSGTPDRHSSLAIDVALGGTVAIPAAVLDEAERAAAVLMQMSPEPFGSSAWVDYHSRFVARYGPGACIPVTELVSGAGLRYPPGYPGSTQQRREWRVLTERDTVLLGMIQRAQLDGDDEIVLTDDDVAGLTFGDRDERSLPDRIELGVVLSASSTIDIDRGQFRLRICATPSTSMAGRFAHLLDTDTRRALRDSYTATPPGENVLVVQLSFPPNLAHDENVVRITPQVGPVVHIGEHPGADTESIPVDDLAVTADTRHLHLIHHPTGRRVLVRIPHALALRGQAPPLARFLAEVGDARTTTFRGFDLGAARTLPYVPRVRHGRTILSPARWLLRASDLPAEPDAVTTWRHRRGVPGRIVVCRGERRLPLDLSCGIDQELLRTELGRTEQVTVVEDDDDHRWIGRTAELLIPLHRTTPCPRPLPVLVGPAPRNQPGSGEVIEAHILGDPLQYGTVLARLPRLAEILGGRLERWWATRHQNLIRPDQEHHLALILRLTDPAHHGHVLGRLAEFCAALQRRGLPHELRLCAYQPQPGRRGHGDALSHAEDVAATDTTAAVAQLAFGEAAAQAWAAASMYDIATALFDDLDGARVLLDQLPRTHGVLNPGVREQALSFADTPPPEPVALAWEARRVALCRYGDTLTGQRDVRSVLRGLLHEHHGRAVGVHPTVEDETNRAARAIALRHLARHRR